MADELTTDLTDEELELIAGQDNPDLDPGEVDVDG